MKQEIIRINLDGVNCYLGRTEEGFVLFDTGGPIVMDKVFTDRREKLVEQLEKAGCRPGNLKAIILTHGDIDHAANAAYLREQYRTVIAMHPDDVNLVEKLTVDKLMQSFHYRSIVLNFVFLLLKKMIRKINTKALNAFTQFTPDVVLQEGDSLSRFGFSAKIIHLPGHTSGSIGVLTDTGELICGDVYANIKKPVPAPNAFDFKQLKSSISKLKSYHITEIYPGHGEPFKQ